MNVARFVGLDSSPRGFTADEASSATHLICIHQTGADANGQRLPLFSLQFEPAIDFAGELPPNNLYFGLLWELIFGHSVNSMRGMSAFLVAMLTPAIYLLARHFLPHPAAILCALTASLSPWAFHLGRFAAMVDFELIFVVLWIYFFIRSQKLTDAIIAGLFLSLTVYSYLAARVQVPLLIIPLILVKIYYFGIERRKSYLTAYFLSAFIVSVPLLFHIIISGSNGRAGQIAIFEQTYLEYLKRSGDDSLGRILRVFLDNFWMYFRPDYLFFTGDKNIRHSTQAVGQLSWLDSTALLAGIFLLLGTIMGWHFASTRSREEPRNVKPFMLFCVIGILTGIVPSALTWEGQPNSVRSVGALPFLVMLTGLILWELTRRHSFTLPVVGALSVLFAVYFLSNFFGSRYAAVSFNDWEGPVRQTAELASRSQDWSAFDAVTRDLPDVATRYFLIEYGGETCESSKDRLSEMRDRRG